MATIITGRIPDVGAAPIDVGVTLSSLYGDQTLNDSFRVRGTGLLVEGEANIYGNVNLFEGGSLYSEGTLRSAQSITTVSGNFYESGIPVGAKIDHLKQSILKTGLVLDLDASNLDSYPKSGTFWHDLTLRKQKGSISGSNPFYNNEFRFETDTDSFITVDGTQGLSPQKFGFATYFQPFYNGSGSNDVIAGKSFNGSDLSFGHFFKSSSSLVSTIRFTDGTKSEVELSNINQDSFHNIFTRWDGSRHIVYTGGYFAAKDDGSSSGKTVAYSSNQPLAVAARYYDPVSSPATATNFFKGAIESIAIYDGEFPELEVYKNNLVKTQLNLHKEVNISGDLNVNGQNIQALIDQYTRADITGNSVGITGTTFEVVNLYGNNYTGIVSGNVTTLNQYRTINNPSGADTTINAGTNTINYDSTTGTITVNNNGVGSTVLFNTEYGGTVDATISGFLFVIEETTNATIHNQNRAIVDRNSGTLNIFNSGGITEVSGENIITIDGGTLNVTGESTSGSFTVNNSTASISLQNAASMVVTNGTNTFTSADVVNFTGDSNVINNSTVNATGHSFSISGGNNTITGVHNSVFNITGSIGTISFDENNTLNLSGVDSVNLTNNSLLSTTAANFTITSGTNTFSITGGAVSTEDSNNTITYGTGSITITSGSNTINLSPTLGAEGGSNTYNQNVNVLVSGGSTTISSATSVSVTGDNANINGNVVVSESSAIGVQTDNAFFRSGSRVDTLDSSSTTFGSGAVLAGGVTVGNNSSVEFNHSNNVQVDLNDDGGGGNSITVNSGNLTVTGNTQSITAEDAVFLHATTGSVDVNLGSSSSPSTTISVTGGDEVHIHATHNENAYGSSNDIDIVNTNSANIYDFSGIINVNMSPTGNSPVSVSDSTGVTINTVSGTDVTISNQAGSISVNNTGSVVVTGQRFVGLNVQNYNGGIAYFSGSSINQFSGNLTATNVDSLDFRAESGSSNTVHTTQFNLFSGNLDFVLPVNAQFTLSDAVNTHIFNSGVVNATGVALISGGIINVDDSRIESLTGQYVSAYNTAVNKAYWTVYSTGAYNFMTGEQVVLKNYESGVVYIDILNKASGIWTGDINIYSGTTNISGIDHVDIYSGEANIYNTNSGLQPHNIDIYDSAITIDNSNAINPYALVSGSGITVIGGVNAVTGMEVTINGGTNTLTQTPTGDLFLFATGNTFNISDGATISILGGSGDNVFSGETVTVTVASGSDATFDIVSVDQLNITGGTLTLNDFTGVDFDFAGVDQINLNNSTSTITGTQISVNNGAEASIYNATGVNVNSGSSVFFYDARSTTIGGSGNVINIDSPRDSTINSDLTTIVGGLNTLTGVSHISGGRNTVNADTLTSLSTEHSTNTISVTSGSPTVTITSGTTNILGSGVNNINGGTVEINGGVNNITGQTFTFLSGAIADFVNSGTVTIDRPSDVTINNTGGHVNATGVDTLTINEGVSVISGSTINVNTSSSISGVTTQTIFVTGMGTTGANVFVTLQSGTIDLSHMVDPQINSSTVSITSGNIFNISGGTVGSITGESFTFTDTVNTVQVNVPDVTVTITGGSTTVNNNSGIVNAHQDVVAYFGEVHNTGTIISNEAEVVHIHHGNFYSSGADATNVHVSGQAFVTGTEVDIVVTNSTASIIHSNSSGKIDLTATNSTIHIPTGHTGVHIHPNTGNDIYVQSGVNRIEAPSTVLHGINTINSTGVVVQAGRNTINTVSGHLTQVYYGNTFVKENSGPVDVSITGGNNYIYTGLVYITGGDHTNVNIYESNNEVYITGENPSVGIHNSTNNFTSNWTGLVQISGTSTNNINNTGLILIDTGANNFIYGGENNLTGINIFITGGVNTYSNNLGALTQITGGVNAIENTGGTLTITGGQNTINTGLVYITGGTNSVSLATVQISGSDVTIGTSDNFVFSNEEINIYGTTNVYASGDQAENILYLINLSGVSGEETARIFNYGTGFKVISGTSFISGENLSVHDSTVGITGGTSQIYYSDVVIDQCDTVTVHDSTGIYITGISGDAHFNNSSNITIQQSNTNSITGGTVTVNNRSGSSTTVSATNAQTLNINSGDVASITVGESGTVNSNGTTSKIDVTGNTAVTMNVTGSTISIDDTDSISIGVNSTLDVTTISSSPITVESGTLNLKSGSNPSIQVTGDNEITINSHASDSVFNITSGEISVTGTVSGLNITGANVTFNSQVSLANIHQPLVSTIYDIETGYFNQGTHNFYNTGISGSINPSIVGGISNISNSVVLVTGLVTGVFQSGSVNSVTGTDATFSFEAQSINEINAPNSTLNISTSTNTINTGSVVVQSGNTNTFISGLSFVTGTVISISGGITNLSNNATGISIDNSTIVGNLNSSGTHSSLTVSGNASFFGPSTASFSNINSEVNIESGATATINGGTNTLNVANTGVINVNASSTISVTGGVFSMSGGQTFNNTTSSTFDVSSASTINNPSGTFNFTGTVNLTGNHNTINIDNPNSVLNFSGNDNTTFNGAITSLSITGSTVNVTSSTGATIDGGTNTISSASNLTIQGTQDSIIVNNSSFGYTGSAPISISGGTNTVSSATNLTISGGTNNLESITNLTLSADNLTINSNTGDVSGANVTINGGENTVTSTASISGGTNTLTNTAFIYSGNTNTINNGTTNITGGVTTVNGGLINIDPNQEVTLENAIISGGINTITGNTVNITGGDSFVISGQTINIQDGSTLNHSGGTISITNFDNSNFAANNNDLVRITGNTVSLTNLSNNTAVSITGGSVTISQVSGGTNTFNNPSTVTVTSGTNNFSAGTTVQQISGGSNSITSSTVQSLVSTSVTGSDIVINSGNTFTVSNVNGGSLTIQSGNTLNITGSASITNATSVAADLIQVNGGSLTIESGDTLNITGSASITNATSVTISGASGPNTISNVTNSDLSIQNGPISINGGTFGVTGDNNILNVTGSTVFASGIESFSTFESTNNITGVFAGLVITGGSNSFNSIEGGVVVDNSFSQTIDSSASNTVVNNNFHNPTIVTGGTVTVTGNSATITEQVNVSQGTVNLTLVNPTQSGTVSMVSITGGNNTVNSAGEVIITGAQTINNNNCSTVSFLSSTVNFAGLTNSTGFLTGNAFYITGGINTCISTGQDFIISGADEVNINGSGNISATTISVNNGNNTISNHNNDITVNYSPSVVSGVNFTVNSGNNVSIYQFRNIDTISDNGKNFSVSTQTANITGGINHVTLTNGDANITGATVILTGDSTSTITDVDNINYHIHNDLTLNSPTGNIVGSIDALTFSGQSLSVSGSVHLNSASDIDIFNVDNVNGVDSNLSLITTTVGGDVNNYGGLTQFYNSTVTYNSVTGQFSNNTVVSHSSANSFVTGDVVRFDNSTSTFVKAIANSEQNSRVAGIISKVSGTLFDVVSDGEFELGGFSAGEQLYLSPTISGRLVTSKPSIPGQYVKEVATSTNDKIIVNVGKSEEIQAFTGTNLVMLKDPSASAQTSNTNTHYTEFTSSEVILMTKEIDLSQTGTHTIHFNQDKRMFVDELGLIFTDVDTINLSPSWKVGVSGSLDSLFNPFRGDHTNVSNNSRERVLAPEDTQGVSSIITTIVSGAAANTCEGKFYFKGFILETE